MVGIPPIDGDEWGMVYYHIHIITTRFQTLLFWECWSTLFWDKPRSAQPGCWECSWTCRRKPLSSVSTDAARHRQNEPAGHDAAAYVEEFKDLRCELTSAINCQLFGYVCISSISEFVCGREQLELSWSETLNVLGRSAAVNNTQPLCDATWWQPVQLFGISTPIRFWRTNETGSEAAIQTKIGTSTLLADGFFAASARRFNSLILVNGSSRPKTA